MSTVPQRLSRLREAMHAHGITACFIPSADPHLSEYLPPRWQGRRWLSGFTGSVGNLIVTDDFAGLWVDSRYWEQAAAELAGTGITMMKTPSAASVAYLDWLAERLPAGATLAVDGAVLALDSSRALRASLAAAGVTLRTDLDLLDSVWTDRAGLPGAPVYEHLPPYASMGRADKLAHVRQAMRSAEADWHLLSTLDDIAWLFNLRGSDVNYNPVFLAHALVSKAGATLFVAPGAIDATLVESLAADGVRVADYADAATALAALPAGSTLLLDPRRVTLGLVETVPESVTRIEAINPSTLAKAQKTDADAAHIRVAMEQDGAALCEFFSWLEQAQATGQRITELDIDEQITAARARQPGFVCPSFGTIAGFNANGAMPHYHATPQSHAVIEGQGLLLIDSGGQYLCGTTDITRVVPVGEPNAEQKRDFTLVLKGMIQLSQAQFPAGTRSPMLDALARAPIWAAGVDYGHGTGHGVGYFLNVHEGPQSIAILRSPDEHTAMLPGMVTSNEPGLYRPGQWGVRIENLLLNVPAASTDFGEFLKFETLTLCPIDTRCVDLALLREDERTWLNNYHAEVRRRLASRVKGEALAWLTRRTEAI
ncbi:aminopeptidase P family protein [Crenobacter sp. SG2305]|uniref:aminopeptidase P family protein n=1 Tax=Crenobacter oryzisoli TaxID=3056844 RepID=UPI0025AB3F5E|nr:aminopeptidase P family protein [Crenobacter sp. SG2305]MDN0085189.1 aminopeptidase P family protein [Crenobacter sp. SG2305]